MILTQNFKILAKYKIFKTEDNVPVGKLKEKLWEKVKFFGILKVAEERSRIRSWIRIRYSEVRIRGSGSAPKCHGSPTMLNSQQSIKTGKQNKTKQNRPKK